MQANYSQKKFWSPNSPFRRDCVFSAYETASFVRRNAAKLLPLPEAMAALTKNMDPKRWRASWLVEKFTSMGMPKRLATDGMVLMFLPDFVASMNQVAKREVETEMADIAFDKMVDARRDEKGREGLAVWSSRPVQISKTPGAPVFKIRQMQLRFKPNARTNSK